MTQECSCDTAKESFTQLKRDVNIYWEVGGMAICKEKGVGRGGKGAEDEWVGGRGFMMADGGGGSRWSKGVEGGGGSNRGNGNGCFK